MARWMRKPESNDFGLLSDSILKGMRGTKGPSSIRGMRGAWMAALALVFPHVGKMSGTAHASVALIPSVQAMDSIPSVQAMDS